jgi:hypothetical protein
LRGKGKLAEACEREVIGEFSADDNKDDGSRDTFEAEYEGVDHNVD